MYKVLYNKRISFNSFEIAVEAPMVIEKALPGQFVIVMTKSDSERIPLTIYDFDRKKGIFMIYKKCSKENNIHKRLNLYVFLNNIK